MGRSKGRSGAFSTPEMPRGYEPSFFPFSAIDRHRQLLEFCDVGDEALGNVIEIFDGDVSEIDHAVRVLCAPQRFTPEEA